MCGIHHLWTHSQQYQRSCPNNPFNTCTFSVSHILHSLPAFIEILQLFSTALEGHFKQQNQYQQQQQQKVKP